MTDSRAGTSAPKPRAARREGGRSVHLSRWQHAKAEAIATVGSPILEGLGGTFSWREYGTEHLNRISRDGRQPIIALWHGRILAGTLYLRDRGLVVIISESFDGEWITRLIRRFGFDTVRGSSSRGGVKALVQLRRDMKEGHPTAFTVDGPRGPARVVQPGVVWLAGATGNPIVPFHIEASAFWTLRSWDRHQIPKPGTGIVAMFGPPVEIPAKAGDTAIEAGQRELTAALERLEQQARRHADLG